MEALSVQVLAHQQLAATWQQRFDTLATLARDGGIESNAIEAIRWRPYQRDSAVDPMAPPPMPMAPVTAPAAVAADYGGCMHAASAVAVAIANPAANPMRQPKQPSPGTKRVYRSCGECMGCRTADCNVCKYCLDKPKLGGSGTLRRRCVLRICERDTEGMPMGVSPPGMMMGEGGMHPSAVAAAALGQGGSAAGRAKRVKKERCGECEGCLTRVDCNECKYCLDKPRLGGSNTLRRICARRVCSNAAPQVAYVGNGALMPLADADAEVAPATETPPVDDQGSVVLALPLAASCPVDYLDVGEEGEDEGGEVEDVVEEDAGAEHGMGVEQHAYVEQDAYAEQHAYVEQHVVVEAVE